MTNERIPLEAMQATKTYLEMKKGWDVVETAFQYVDGEEVPYFVAVDHVNGFVIICGVRMVDKFDDDENFDRSLFEDTCVGVLMAADDVLPDYQIRYDSIQIRRTKDSRASLKHHINVSGEKRANE